jgi:hypothetical protein
MLIGCSSGGSDSSTKTTAPPAGSTNQPGAGTQDTQSEKPTTLAPPK